MRVNVSMSDDLLKMVDSAAKEMYVSRSAFIAMAVAEKIKSDTVVKIMPELMELAKKLPE